MDVQTSSFASALQAVIDRAPSKTRARVEEVSALAAARARAAAPHWDFDLPAREVDAVLGPDAGDDLRRALIAWWAMDLEARAGALALPPEVMGLYPYWLGKLTAFLEQAESPYDPDFWAKDVRFALALSVPGARSQVIDLTSPLGPGPVFHHVREGHGLDAAWRYMRAGWRATWLEVHTESRHLDDFTEEGWNNAWRTAAAICKGRPDLAGMIGSSWFYDPPLTDISPRLAHLRLNPLKGGAFMIHLGPKDIHTQRAAAASPTRKALIESGQYTARSWLMVWPRKALIAWADFGSA